MFKKLILTLGIVCCALSFNGCDMSLFESPKERCTYKETDDFLVKSKRTDSYTSTHCIPIGKTIVPMTNTHTDYYVTLENKIYGTYELESEVLYREAVEGTYVQADFYSDGEIAYFRLPEYNVESSLLKIKK